MTMILKYKETKRWEQGRSLIATEVTKKEALMRQLFPGIQLHTRRLIGTTYRYFFSDQSPYEYLQIFGPVFPDEEWAVGLGRNNGRPKEVKGLEDLESSLSALKDSI